MNRFFDTISNPRGDILPNHRVRVLTSSDVTVPIFSDAGGTNFPTANTCVVDANGFASFFWEAASGQKLEIQDSGGNRVFLIERFADNQDLANTFGTLPDAAVPALANKANASAIGVAGSAANLGTFTSPLIDDDATVKAALESIGVNLFSSIGASFVRWLQQGVGAVVRSLQDKLHDTVNVRDFGAVGNGVADDTAAINAALSSGAKRVRAKYGVYKTTAPITLPSGVSFIGDGDNCTTILKAHSGDAIHLNNGLSYNPAHIKGFKVSPAPGFALTGWGLRMTQAVRTKTADFTIEDLAGGHLLDGCIACSSRDFNIDRCSVALETTAITNHNDLTKYTIISNGGIGVKQRGYSICNDFNTFDIEYASTTFDLGDRTTNTTFRNLYTEFNSGGGIIRAGCQTVVFDGVFNSSAPFLAAVEDGAVPPVVNNIDDRFPVGLGGVPLTGNLGYPRIATIQALPITLYGVTSSAFDYSDSSKFGLNAGSHFEWVGQPYRNFINSQDISNAGQWSGGGAVTAVSGGSIGGQAAYTLAAGAFRSTSVSLGTPMAGRTFVFCVLIEGAPGGTFDLRVSDNVTGTQIQSFQIGVSGKRYAYFKNSWGAGSTNANGGPTIFNTGSSDIKFSIPCFYEAEGPLPLMIRTQSEAGYLSYPIVRYFNFGRNVEVYDNIAPASGAWAVGDRAIMTTPVAAGVIGRVNTTAGSPGTWKTFGAVEA